MNLLTSYSDTSSQKFERLKGYLFVRANQIKKKRQRHWAGRSCYQDPS